MKSITLSSHVAADVLTARTATLLRIVSFGRLVLMWDTGRPIPERKAGAR